MTEEATKITRQSRKVSYSIFEQTMKELEVTESTLCKALGYDDTASRAWKVNNAMPMVASVACEALRRRNGKNFSKTILVRTNSQQQFDTIAALCRGLNIEFVDI